MKIYLEDIEDVIVCKCGLIYDKNKICKETDDYAGLKKGNCKVCGGELLD